MKKLSSKQTTQEDSPLTENRLTASTLRWVKIFGVIGLILLLLVIILHLTGNSLGGPGMHHTPPSSTINKGE
ncbi:hypothetical protein J7E63_10665 [Bacillus sp. ISL-75]|uniref:hypothetical protein n=1 Tax=Bacillus sp. ISL-75 TaxID=2819137 RepID=UPI001BEAF076|nr:hypothetical protein [Bacillus sp. ISL-75]MBT2727396.1 hypothetical protein [Bacillus sp. ISL-75]